MVEMAGFGDVFAQLQELGFYDYVLPWLLSFAIVYGILETVQIFRKGGQSNKSVNVIISMVMAFFVSAYSPYTGFLATFFTNMFGGSIVMLATILVFILFLGMVGLFEGGKSFIFEKYWWFWAGLLLAVAGILFFNATGFGIEDYLGSMTEVGTWVVFLAFIGMAIYLVTKKEDYPKK
jgi:hypothetical protein